MTTKTKPPEPFPTLKDLPLDALRLDGGTQPRARIDPETVREYAERMKAGDHFPPVTVYFDGADHWLSDGFHRVKAAPEAGLAAVQANVWEGTRDDAFWMSLAANKDHGLRRTNEDKARAVKAALAARPRLSDRAIADHVGVTHPFVAKCRAEMTGNGYQSAVRTGRDGRTINTAKIGKSKRPKTYFDDDPGEAADPDSIPLDLEDGQDTTGDADAPVTDRLGRPVEGKVAEAFRRRGEITGLMSAVSKVKSTVLKAIEAGNPLFAGILASRFQADCKNVYGQLAAALPYAACPYCRAAGCKACHNRGWVGKLTWDAAPKELKA